MSSDVIIVTYLPDYADGIAEMWNRSQDHWGGGTSVVTGAQIRTEEANSDALVVFLAIYDKQVVGYCSVSEYREDTGALYINLLNVRPDYHGKKIGKLLVLRAVEETIQRGWPRLDLYTWDSNMKAVPLYKKCGFFWEDREDRTHFMNFIPQIVNCEALAPYIEGFDWYADSTRVIEVKRDGQDTNGFHTYTYSWSKDDRNLRVDIERRGRGICLIETDEYKIEAVVEQAEPVFGRSYSVEYKLVNKSGALLYVELVGEPDRNIQFDWKQSVHVDDEQVLKSSFYVDKIEEEQNDWRTCPTVRTQVKINGREALFQVGLVPKHPAKLTLKAPDALYAVGGSYSFYLDIESHMQEPANFVFELPEMPWLAIEERTFDIHLEAKERTSIRVPFRLLDYGFYHAELNVKVRTHHGQGVEFSRWIGGTFSGPGAMFTGKDDEYYWLVNGNHTIRTEKASNNTIFDRIGHPARIAVLLHPLIGKPYSSEFSKKSPQSIEWLEERGAVGMKQTYHSEAFPGIILHCYMQLHGDGTVKLWQEVENVGEISTSESLWMSQRIGTDLYRFILPYDGRYIETTDSHSNDYSYWDSSRITEPWMFTRGDSISIGMCWTEAYRLYVSDRAAELEYEVGQLEPGMKRKTDTITLSLGGFDDWKSFRSYAIQRHDEDTLLQLTPDIELITNDRNSFLYTHDTNVSATLRDVKQNVWEGEVSARFITDKVQHESLSKAVLTDDDEEAEATFRLPVSTASSDVIEVSAKLGPLQENYHSALFTVSEVPVQETIGELSGYSIYESYNGRIRIQAADQYYPGLCKLEVDGQSWLDSGLPHYEAKSWWNPWIGGMSDSLEELHVNSILKAEREASFVRMKDSAGNEWSGIRISFTIKDHDVYKGLRWDGYYLMLPNVPVLAYVSDIHQNTGTYWDGKEITTDLSLNTNSEQQAWLRTFRINGEVLHYRLGEGELEVRESQDYVLGRETSESIMHVVTDESVIKPHVYSNKALTYLSFNRTISVPDGAVRRSAPVFLAFDDHILPRTSLSQLRKLTFPRTSEHNE